MRYKIIATIIEKTKLNKRNYHHETQSMLLNKLPPSISQKMHKKEKAFKLLTFTNICIDKDSCHFYISGEDNIVNTLVKVLSVDNIVRIDDMVLAIISIIPMSELPNRAEYIFKTKLIINVFDSEKGKNKLCEDINVVTQRLVKNSLDKCKYLGIDSDNLSIEVLNPTKSCSKYKEGHIFSWKCNVKISGDYEVINTIYNVGLGENTFTGHGLLWEARC